MGLLHLLRREMIARLVKIIEEKEGQMDTFREVFRDGAWEMNMRVTIGNICITVKANSKIFYFTGGGL